jgi:acyl-CoA dehydrogenase
VPKTNLVGEEGKGWSIAKYLLTHEREMIGEMGSAKPISQMLKTAGITPSPFLAAKLATFEADDWAFSQTMTRMLAEAKAGASLGAKSSMLKYYGTELNKRRYELMMDAAGHDGLEWESERSNDGKLARSWLRTKGNSIEGGTSEVQLNIISKHILQLPGA